MAERGLIGRLLEAAEDRTGMTVVPQDRLELLEQVEQDYTSTRKELDLLGWTALDYLSGNPQELETTERRKLAQRSRVVWMSDPQAGAATDLTNDFTFGRGVPKPKANDEAVQEVIDEAWDDPDNQLILTSYAAQIALGTDLMLQSNVFLLMFDEGEDGKVKLGLLDHDTVEQVVRDPNNRLRVMYYVAKERRYEWDFENDKPKALVPGFEDRNKPQLRYYEHWRNVQDAEEAGDSPDKPPERKRGEGRVYHIAINRTSEMAFGVPTMRRTMRWFSAYNDFMKARVDMAQAAASFIMRRKVKGTPNQVASLAAKALSRRSELASSDPNVQTPPAPGSILTENENVSHESMKIDSQAGNAAQDAQMLRSSISAATRFPQHYLGDAGSANLATATAMELPVLKAVEARQEVFEGVFRWFLDRVIEKAVDDGRLDKYADEQDTQVQDQPNAAPGQETQASQALPTDLAAAHEDAGVDEQQTERDLSYEFNMPNPLRRMMADLITAIVGIAQTFDPNGTNIELSRILLSIALGEGLEVEDPGKAVERIFPEGYEDPALAAYRQQQEMQPPQGPANPFQPNGSQPPQGENNPYSAPQFSQPPEKSMQQAAIADLPPQVQAAIRAQQVEVAKLMDTETLSIVQAELAALLTPPRNGHPA